MKKLIFALLFTTITCICFCITALGLQYTPKDYDLAVYQYSIENDEVIIDKVVLKPVNDIEVIFPEEIEGYPVTKIKSDAFDSTKSQISKIILPAGLKSIDDNTFERFNNLHTVVFNDGLEYIGNSAFYKCKNLKDVKIPKGVTFIGNSAFYECTGLKTVFVPGSVETIGDSAFYNCTSLENVTFLRTLRYIHEYAFYGCSSLTEIVIPNSVTELGNNTFGECINLKKLIIPAQLIPKHVTDVIDVENIFYNDNAIETIVVKNGTYDKYTLWYWFQRTKWAERNKPKSETGFRIIDNVLIEYDGDDKNPVIPEGVKSIGNLAFRNTQIDSVTIPKSVTSISMSAFIHSTIKKIVIPSNVRTIGNQAFAYCKRLTTLKIEDGVKTVGSEAFLGCIRLIPEQCVLSTKTKYNETAFDDTPFDEDWNPTEIPESQPEPDIEPVKEIIVQNKIDGPELYVNGEKIIFTDVVPFIDEAYRTQMPVRAIVEVLGCKVDYIDGLVIIRNEDNIINLTIGSNIMSKNGENIKMDTNAIIHHDRTFLPIRYIAEALDYTVKWEITEE